MVTASCRYILRLLHYISHSDVVVFDIHIECVLKYMLSTQKWGNGCVFSRQWSDAVDLDALAGEIRHGTAPWSIVGSTLCRFLHKQWHLISGGGVLPVTSIQK